MKWFYRNKSLPEKFQNASQRPLIKHSSTSRSKSFTKSFPNNSVEVQTRCSAHANNLWASEIKTLKLSGYIIKWNNWNLSCAAALVPLLQNLVRVASVIAGISTDPVNFVLTKIFGLQNSGTFPIDTTKTRLQIQEGRTNIRYNGMLDCGVKIYKQEGLRSLYSGLDNFPKSPRKSTHQAFRYF